MSPSLVLILLLGYFGILLLVSIITTRRAGNQSFFIGDRNSRWYIVAFGMIGASLSGITFISVPGWVLSSNFHYMQIVLGYLLGYAAVVHVLLPVYYRLNLTSIYTYLDKRFGVYSYKTGSVFFLISRIIGASFRLFIVANVLQLAVFDQLNVPFSVSVLVTLTCIYIYTYRGGIKTIVWTDTLQTFFMLASVGISILFISRSLDLTGVKLLATVVESDYSRIFNFSDWRSRSFFFKQFFSGAFITIVMTGLDQDMMQKNLSCRNLKEARKNMYWYGSLLLPVNLLFLTLGVLLVLYAQHLGVALPERSDDLFPMLATGGYFPAWLGVIFLLGLIAAAYSSADSALTALTTSFTLDILNAGSKSEEKLRHLRWLVHVGMSIIIGAIIYVFRLLNNEAVISSLFLAAGYTYGPLLGLYTFGLFSKRLLRDKLVPVMAIAAPVISYGIKTGLEYGIDGYRSGYEILLINGFIAVLGFYILSIGQGKSEAENKECKSFA